MKGFAILLSLISSTLCAYIVSPRDKYVKKSSDFDELETGSKLPSVYKQLLWQNWEVATPDIDGLYTRSRPNAIRSIDPTKPSFVRTNQMAKTIETGEYYAYYGNIMLYQQYMHLKRYSAICAFPTESYTDIRGLPCRLHIRANNCTNYYGQFTPKYTYEFEQLLNVDYRMENTTDIVLPKDQYCTSYAFTARKRGPRQPVIYLDNVVFDVYYHNHPAGN